VLREVAASHTFDKLLAMPEVMRFIDRDETLAKVFRDPDFLKNGKEFFKTGNGGPGTAKTSPESASAKVFADAFQAATGTPIGGASASSATEEQQQQQQQQQP
jgi:hypothetical protein